MTETVSLSEVGRRLGIPTGEVLHMIDRGELDGVIVDRRIRVSIVELARLEAEPRERGAGS